MKKMCIIFIFVTLMILSACGRQKEISECVESSNVTTEVTVESDDSAIKATDETETTEHIEADEKNEEFEEVIPEEAFDLSDKDPMEAIRAVLLGEAPVIYHDYGVVGTRLSYEEDRVYLGDMFDKFQRVITEFAIKDMDGDGISEMIMKWQYDNGFYMLRYWNGKVICSEFPYRGLRGIREDGSSSGSNSSSESFVHKLFFIGDSAFYFMIAETDLTRYPFDSRYYVYDVQVKEEEWRKVDEMHYALPEIEWYEFNEEEICKRVSDAMENGEEMSISKERQEYLDTFSYLMELRKSLSSNGQEAYNEAAKRYYYNAIAEMEYIYKLYKSTLSVEELEKLEAEQKTWQEAIDLRLVKSLYDKRAYSIEELESWGLFFDHGDFYLSRACRLVNWYYGCDYYE